MTDKQKAKNRVKSKTRARVEHVFGFMPACRSLGTGREQSMNGLKIKSIGIARATGIIGLINFTYKLFRYKQVVRLNLLTVK